MENVRRCCAWHELYLTFHFQSDWNCCASEDHEMTGRLGSQTGSYELLTHARMPRRNRAQVSRETREMRARL